MQGIIQKCLETCDKLRLSTIAFPALGAGNLKFPPTVVADIMVNTIAGYLKANRSVTHIKTVKLVIFMDDTYAEFDKLLSGRPSVTDSSVLHDTLDDAETLISAEMFHRTKVLKSAVVSSSAAEVYTAGKVKVEIMQGDITEDDSDVIVSTANPSMQRLNSGMAAAVLNKGGPELQVICNSFVLQGNHLQEGKVYDARATGNLKCRKVFFVVVLHNHKQMLGKTIAACLKQAEKLHLSSIAFPAIGTGNLGFSIEETAHGISSSIAAFGQKSNPVYVKRVRVIIYQQEMYQSFKDKYNEVTHKPGILKRMGNAVMSWFHGDGSLEAEEPAGGIDPHSLSDASKITNKSILLIQIYAEDEQSVQNTADRLQKIIDEQFTNEKMPNELISKLTQKQKQDLESKAKQLHVQIDFETGMDLSYVQLKGDCTDVANLKVEIQELLGRISSLESEKREAKLLAAKVKWQWLSDINDFEDYDDLPNYHIEKAYQRNKNIMYTYKSEDGTVENFNFQKMEADDTKSRFKIKRVDIEDLLKEGMYNHLIFAIANVNIYIILLNQACADLVS